MNDPKGQKYEPEARTLVVGKSISAAPASVKSDPRAQGIRIAGVHRRMRAQLRSAGRQADHARRKTVVERVFRVLKQQRGMR
jgi:hypothetical protein